jgi:hypothetical protein
MLRRIVALIASVGVGPFACSGRGALSRSGPPLDSGVAGGGGSSPSSIDGAGGNSGVGGASGSSLGGAGGNLLTSVDGGGGSGSSLGGAGGTLLTSVDGGDGGTLSSVDGGEGPFSEWWNPPCTTSTGACGNGCIPVLLLVAPYPCGVTARINAGCVGPRPTNGWYCWFRRSDNTIIQSEYPPATENDLESCEAAGLPYATYYAVPLCDGGDGDTASSF